MTIGRESMAQSGSPTAPVASGDTGKVSGALQGSRYRQVLPWLRGDLLEIGCGWSDLPSNPPSSVTSYAGCDLEQSTVDRLTNAYPEHRFVALDLDAADYPDDYGPFDTILAAAVIEHLFNLRSVMERLIAVLRPGGRIVMTTPTPIGNDFVLPLTAALGLTSRTAHDDHIAILNKKRFRHLSQEVGLELIQYNRFQLGMNSLAVMELPRA